MALINSPIDEELRLINEESNGLSGDERESLLRGIVASPELQKDPKLVWAEVRTDVAQHAYVLSEQASERLQRSGRSMGTTEP